MRRRLAMAITIAVLLGMTVASPASASDPGRTALPQSQPGWAAGARDLGPLPDNTPISIRLYLQSRDPAGLDAAATAVSVPDSAAYRHFLSPQVIRQRFGPSPDDLSRLRAWLTSAGLTMGASTAHYVDVHGTAGRVAAAFEAPLHRYAAAQGPVWGPKVRPTAPTSVASAVLAVSGLSSAASPSPSSGVPLTQDATDCSESFGSTPASRVPKAYGHTPPWAICGYDGAQIRGAYGVTASGMTGAGATIAIVNAGALPHMRIDADRVARDHGDRPFRDGQYGERLLCAQDDSCARPGGYNAEEALDVEAVHAMAPGTRVLYVGASTMAANASLDALTDIVDHRLADIVSNSWYLKGTDQHVDPGTVSAYEQVFLWGALEGITFDFGTGDAGDQAFGELQPGWDDEPSVNFPASDPWVTAVGGTSLAVGPQNQYRFETGWGTALASLSPDGAGWALPGVFGGGAGGGTSEHFAQPWYQRGVVPESLSSDAGDTAMRVTPDLAADADPATGLRIGYTDPSTNVYAEHTVGGTSLACPLVAGMEAVVQQARHGIPGGFLNPAFYRQRHYLHDVTDAPLGHDVPVIQAIPNNKKDPGNPGLITLGRDTSLTAMPGYDPVTGLGSPTYGFLMAATRTDD